MGISPIHFHDIHRSLAEPVEFVRSPQGRLVGRESIGFLGVLHRDPPLVDLLNAQIGSVGKPVEDIALRLTAIHGVGRIDFRGRAMLDARPYPLNGYNNQRVLAPMSLSPLTRSTHSSNPG